MSKLYITTSKGLTDLYPTMKKSKYILASYYYVKSSEEDFVKGWGADNFILDSGAFSFSAGRDEGKKLYKEEVEEYLEGYIDYIKRFNVKHFVELDIDSIFGYGYVLELREKLEKAVGRKCIPIWHSSRGKDEFIRMCKEYDYAGVGGIAGGEELSKHKDKYFMLNRLAKRYGSKLHGMGFTPTERLNQYGFYSVDSTSWRSGGRFGVYYFFDGTKLRTLPKREGKRASYRELDEHNLQEWIKYQKYVDVYD